MAKSLFIRKAILRVLEMLFGVHHPLVAKYLNYLGRLTDLSRIGMQPAVVHGVASNKIELI